MSLLLVSAAVLTLFVVGYFAWDRHRGITAAREFGRWAWSFLVFVRVARIEDNKEVDRDHGSGIFIRLNGHVYLLTAWHVLERLFQRRSNGERVVLVMDNFPIYEPRAFRLEQDIGLVWIHPSDYPKIETNIFNAETNWKPVPMTTDDHCVFIGFPRSQSVDTEKNTIDNADLAMGLPVTAVGPGYAMLQMDRKQMMNLGRVPIPAEDELLGGISGCPVFGIRPPFRFLAGIVSEAPKGLPLFRVSTLESLEGFTPSE